jgi:hypothetical protein
VFALALALAVTASCGARTGLLGYVPEVDASTDAEAGEPIVDAQTEPDAEAEADVVSEPDVVTDGLAPCDPEDLFVYVVTEEESLYRFDPPSAQFTLVGPLACPTTSGSPFSMAVSRTGTAYVLYTSLGVPGAVAPGRLFAVSTKDASCQETSFLPGQHGFDLFGMGFAINADQMGETLFVGSSTEGASGTPPPRLGSIDVSSFDLTEIGAFSGDIGTGPELTSSGDGQLYGYYTSLSGFGGHIIDIDKQTAAVQEIAFIPADITIQAFAFAYWGGDFYVFTSPLGGPTTVTRYRPSDGSISVVGSLGATVVGAGVTTCT